jgi:hypothetical protein
LLLILYLKLKSRAECFIKYCEQHIYEKTNTHADALRYEELQSMEERAYIASIKVLIPIAVFLLPAILLILGGPMLILVIRSLQDIS